MYLQRKCKPFYYQSLIKEENNESGNNCSENSICVMTALLGEECVSFKIYPTEENINVKAYGLRSAPEASKRITE